MDKIYMNIAIGNKRINISILIKEEILEVSKKLNIPVNISIFTNGTELLIDKNKFDIIFLDTDMNNISGIQIANCIRITNNTTKLIFISDNDDLVFQVLKYQPYRFIRKRYLKKELKEAIISFFQSTNNSNTFICRTGNINIPVNLNEIFFFEIFGHNIEVHTVNRKIHITGTLNTLQNQLEPFGFMRIHKSYLVNIKHILNFDSKNITMSNMIVLPFSKYRNAEFKRKIKDYNMKGV